MKNRWNWNWSQLTNNWGVKVVSVLFAVAIWLIVTNINDPVIPYKVYNVPVKLINTELITNQGQVYEVLDETDVIDVVTVSAPRSIIDALSNENIVATADISEITALDTVAIKLSTNKYNDKLESIRGNFDSVKLLVEEKQTITRALRTNLSGDVSEGYLVGDINTDQNLIRISGPESIVSQVDKAMVDVTVTGFTNNIVTDADVRLYDREGNEVNRDKVTMNVEKVKVSVEVLETKEIPVRAEYMGTPAEGYQATGEIELEMESVVVAGKSNALRGLSQILIPKEKLDLTDQTESLVTMIDLRDYMPSGVRLADTAASNRIEVSVIVEKEVEKTYELSADAIEIRNIPEGMQAVVVYDEEVYEVTAVGLNRDFRVLGETLECYIDLARIMEEQELEELTPGYYTVQVRYELQDTDIVVEEQEVTIEITERSE